jgi:hypothetical protein
MPMPLATMSGSTSVRLRQLRLFETVGMVQGLKILLVRPSSPLFARNRAERMSRRSIREPVDDGGFDQPTYYARKSISTVQLHPHAVLLGRDRFGVGIIVLERRPIIEFYRCTKPSWELAGPIEHAVRWTVVHVWILPELRRQGIATNLVDIAIREYTRPRTPWDGYRPSPWLGFPLWLVSKERCPHLPSPSEKVWDDNVVEVV